MKTGEYEAGLCRLAAEAGFIPALMRTDQFKFVPEYRRYCEENRCGSYNRNYACPPYCGTPEEMEVRVRVFGQALVLQSKASVRNAMDPDETGSLKKLHNRKTLELVRRIKQEWDLRESLTIMAGPCSLCETCGMIRGIPCPMELDRCSCLSAYCIDVAELAAKAGLELSWAMDQSSFFSIFLFNKKDSTTHDEN